jgi:DHA2 family multidrug resistance protein
MAINAQVTRQAGGLPYKWVMAIVLVFGAFMSILDQTVVNIAIPRLQSAFG